MTTIDIVMERIRQHANTAADVARGYIPVQRQTESEEDMYVALLALVAQARDEEAEAIQSAVHQVTTGLMTCDMNGNPATEYIRREQVVADIRARIAARKGENHD